MIRFRTFVWSLCVLLAGSAWPQQQAPAGGSQTLTYSVEVELAQVAVRVTDKDGKWVSGLTDKDFELTEDGTPEEIRYVDEIETDEKTAPTPEPAVPAKQERKEITVAPVFWNSVILIFDGSNSGQIGIEKHRKYVEQFLREYDAPNTMFALFFINPAGSYELLTTFTEDKTLLIDALKKVRGTMAGWEDKVSKVSQLADDTLIVSCSAKEETTSQAECIEQALTDVINRANSLAQEDQRRSTNTMHSLQEIFDLAQHVPGEKSVIYISEGLDPTGGFYYNYGANVIRYFLENFGLPPRYRSWINEIQADASRSVTNIQEVRDLIKSANAAGLSVFWANPQFGKSISDIGAENRAPILSSAIVNAPSIDATMRGIAEDTGGAALDSMDPSKFYKRISGFIPRYYLINYKPSRPVNDGRFHTIHVRARNKNYRVAYGKDYKDLSVKDRVQNELAGAHDFPDITNRFPMLMDVRYFKKPDGKYEVMVHAGVSYEDIEPLDLQTSVTDDLHFSFLVRDREGNVLFDTHPILKVRSSESEFAQLRKNKALLEYIQSYTLDPGTYTISLASMDLTGWKTASRIGGIDLPGDAEKCLSLSPVMLASSVRPTPTATAAPVTTKEGNIQYGRNVFTFAVRRTFPVKGVLSGFYQVYNAKSGPDSASPSVGITFKLFRDKTAFVNETTERKTTAYTEPIQRLISSYFSVPYNNLPPGSYELAVLARDLNNSACSSEARVAFDVVAPATGEAKGPTAP